jgi:hypothetical protein
MTTPKFFPRPEAHPMQWATLMPPIKRAVRDLLVRIEGATSKEINKEGALANCFLIYGERGTGKTTVLLSAKYACEKTDVFFSDSKNGKKTDSASKPVSGGGASGAEKTVAETQNQALLADAQHSAEKARNIVWLDVLDLEPLSPGANLLATVLTRVRNALCQSGSGKDVPEFTSILEDGSGHSDSARQKFGQLISDAAMMWQEIDESDTRSRANRHVDAADKYALFKERFRGAMEALSAELARRKGSRNSCYRIIFPIDNIDRSAEHLNSIVKLAQMLSCPYLWLVMAGDRQDIETFLERAYWKELIRVGEGAGGVGKADSDGEDETLVMARRQAAAASHKLLPPSHRVEVELMQPEDTLKFSHQDDAADSNSTLQQLLQKIKVEKADSSHIDFIDFFNTQNFVQRSMGEVADRQKEPHHQYFTNAAKFGLHLPARSVLDLWRLAYWVREDGMIKKDDQAEKIARTMLRNSIAESAMSNKMGRCLQEKIIRRKVDGGTSLVFGDLTPALEAHPLRRLVFNFRTRRKMVTLQEDGGPEIDIRSTLTVLMNNPMNLSLKRDPKDNPKNSDDLLPELVAAWLAVLCDIAMWSNKSSILRRGSTKNPIGSICIVTHDASNGRHPELTMSITWPMPSWSTFMENEVCGQFWDFFLHHLDESKELFDQACRENCLPRLLAVGWVACALQTFSLFAPGDWQWAKGIFKTVTQVIQEWAHVDLLAEAVVQAERSVMLHAAELYQEIVKINDGNGAMLREEDGAAPMRDWLERELPLMWLTDLHVPPVGDAQNRVDVVFKILGDTGLMRQWEMDLDQFRQKETEMVKALLRPSTRTGS